MTPIQWNTIIASMAITSQPAGLWTPVIEYLPGGTLVRVMAWGTWSYSGQIPDCGPDGHRVSFIPPQRCLSKDAQVGALICKVGGGTGDLKGTVFPVGSLSIFTVPDGGGALFMTINDEIGGFDDNLGQITVSIAVRLTGAST
jgi:hypothetical protein